jgi:hypothetical protein
MDPKALLVAQLQAMQGGQAPAGPPMPPEAMAAAPMGPGEPLGDPSSPDNTPAHENAESPALEKAEGSEEDMGGEAYSHADMIAHHDSIAGLIQVLVNMTQNGPSKGAGMKLGIPSQIEQQSAASKGY